MTIVVAIAVVVLCLVVAAIVDVQARRRRSRIDGRAIAAELRDRRRDLRARRSMMNIGVDPDADRRR